MPLCVRGVQCQALWDRVKGEQRWSKEWGTRALAAVQRTSVSLAAFGDRLYLLTQPFAERCSVLYFSQAASCCPKALTMLHLSSQLCKQADMMLVMLACW